MGSRHYFKIILRGDDGYSPPSAYRRLARLLKSALRNYDLKVVEHYEVDKNGEKIPLDILLERA